MDLTAHLCEGLGGEEDNTKQATFVEGHIASFHLLRKNHKTWGKARVATGPILRRYREASRSFLRECRCMSLACDASRIVGKDVLLVACLGTASDGTQKAC